MVGVELSVTFVLILAMVMVIKEVISEDGVVVENTWAAVIN